MIDYEALRIIWWVLLGVLLIGFAIMDGFDLGVAIWLPWLPKTEMEKRILINAIGPTWEGNQVWFILGAGAIFAAWPSLYALAFSGFYYLMLAVLLALILRPVGFKYRSKVNHPLWKKVWDICLFVSGFVPTLIFGLAIGKVLQGLPFYFDEHLRIFTTGSFANLDPFSLICGFLSLCMLMMHGAYFLNVKTEGHIQKRARLAAQVCSLVTVTLFIGAGFYLYYYIDGFMLVGNVAHDGPSNPLYKMVIRQPHAWFANYEQIKALIILPCIGILAPVCAILLAKKPKSAFCFSALGLFGLIATVGISMFPFILPSETNPMHSLLVWDSSSSEQTLVLMLIATLIFMPIILCYTAWVYRVLRGKVTGESIEKNSDVAY